MFNNDGRRSGPRTKKSVKFQAAEEVIGAQDNEDIWRAGTREEIVPKDVAIRERRERDMFNGALRNILGTCAASLPPRPRRGMSKVRPEDAGEEGLLLEETED
ncbi:hypothetical protein E8E12_007801 [Didymella heteroderae]|uniref:Uncharacterized protein n=1 Tax=Didymella heteroderae TaxID=1769908 RepID=A0A9P4X121_9PLEO|nr:hypothetical protein E8E12_007801 [Didymella heteroderae]